jgi:hypothetical protein
MGWGAFWAIFNKLIWSPWLLWTTVTLKQHGARRMLFFWKQSVFVCLFVWTECKICRVT